ncbi:hypothetical protein [Gaopeijia maritima]|uniref:Cytochrome c domain-containing protein n=1 Tax=Gaopeijia maritima TaxID=3119007 RepID=A0ABU9E920_9BACT
MRGSVLMLLVAGAALVVGGSRPVPASVRSGEAGMRPEVAADTSDPVARLEDRIAAGEHALAWDSAQGYLKSLLASLDIPESSQTLVFSRTSLQTDRIAPWAPRALYFNDDVYIGWVQESPIIEIASVDPDLGVLFYTLEQKREGPPTFTRETTTCLICHESRSVTGGIPGLMVRSVLTDRLGYPITEVHEGATTDRTPLEERWGGWYLTGSHPTMAHAGNVMSEDLFHEVSQKGRYLEEFAFRTDSGVPELSDRFYVEPYLTPHSDLVAIMVLTHQTQVHNLISLVKSEAEAALRLEEIAIRSRGDEAGTPPFPTTLARIVGPVERLLETMLFKREAPLAGPMRGSSSFTADFEALGPRDASGRSLREFDLERRLFRYPLSFLVYSEAFDALPELARTIFAARLVEVLTGADTSDDFAHLDEADRAAILAILRDTRPELIELADADPRR